MTEKVFHIYRSSAGSGKTRTLAKEYLKLALRYPEYFRYILAMTFTNKSTQEMKDRIIRYLDDFVRGKSEDLATEIMNDFQAEGRSFTPKQFADRSREVLSLILHHYSQFSVSTIDAFFQRVIRSFTRETNLLGNFRLEVDNDLVLEEVIDQVMDNLSDDEELRGWVLEFSLERLVEGKDWDIRSALLDFSKEIFKEEFKAIEDQVLRITENKEFFKSVRIKLQQVVKQFESQVQQTSRNLLKDFHVHNLSITDFKYGKSGSIYSYIAGLEEEIKLPGMRVMNMLNDSREWPAPKNSHAALIVSKAEQQWRSELATLVEFIEQQQVSYYSAEQALRNLYVFGLLSDISKTLREYLRENNLMLLSDAPQFLRGVMQDQDTSFIYEKVGSFYRHFLIDEFQDTSGFQWKNLLPLVKNGISQNYRSLIVGDIKQSIYRWRGGDLNILQEKVKEDIGIPMIDIFPLDTNYRSAGNVVTFNNALFDAAAAIIGKETGTTFPQESYQDAAQKLFRHPDKGYISIQFIDSAEASLPANGDTADKSAVKFEDLALEQLPRQLEELQANGIALRDIAFLVRDNSEGQMIAQYFMQYRSSPEAKPGYKYDVVSNESLRLDQSASVVVLINAMRLLEDPRNLIARAQLSYEYQKLWPQQAFPNLHQLFSRSKTKDFARLVPPPFTAQEDVLAALPLVELVENLIHIFNLGKLSTEIAYLQAFQDVVLEFGMREKSDLASFLQWWEENKHKKSIQVAGGVDAAQIITIHKSKGLQFRYVIIPFLHWELNHPPMKSPILWCRSDEPLFKDIGYLPLKYSSKLENTTFKDYYTEERKRIYLDNLNLLYVAFTRAEYGLIALSPLAKSGSINHVGKLTMRAIESSDTLRPYWSAEKKALTIGAIDPENIAGKTEESLVLKSYSITPWRERLQIRTRGKEFFEQTAKRKKINYGIFLHALMARIKTAADVATTLEQAVKEGMIQHDERAQIEESVQWIVTHPKLQDAFSPEALLKREASLLVPGGERRIDRMAILDNRAWLIDYKTGAPKQEDEQQIKEYIAILQTMGVSEVKGFLVYVNERECKAV
ncbi:MAG TPA: UvrD-helicase domain-containing protein [Ohtaekwangia sp.]|uniref:UvrD-helicase domain-containing protein n=1 Tax=Ohtaekwangia sp. TaxID=2066019 RepID=UPI002F9267CE